MKHLTLIVHTSVKQDLSDQLRSMEKISGFTFSPAEGHGVQAENDPFLSSRDKVVGYTPRVRVDILLEESDVDIVLDTLRTSTSGIKGQAIFWVSNIEKNGHL